MTQFPNKKYDLQERTAKFGENTIIFCKNISLDAISSPIVNQLIRSSTSIGANYTEANNAVSKKDFRNKIYICKKEAEETKHWLRMLDSVLSNNKEELAILAKECQELIMIFQKITNSLKN